MELEKEPFLVVHVREHVAAAKIATGKGVTDIFEIGATTDDAYDDDDAQQRSATNCRSLWRG